MLRFVFSLLVGLCLCSSQSYSGDKNLSALFPGIASIDVSGLKDLSSPEYQSLIQCQNSADKAADCDPTGTAHFYLFTPTVTDLYGSFDIANRCILVHQSLREVRSPVVIDPVARTVTCAAAPNEVVTANLVICYERAAGSFCNLSTACFEGDNTKGRCTKDFTEDPIFLGGNNLTFTP